MIAAAAAVSLLVASNGSLHAQVVAGSPPAPPEDRPNRTFQHIVTGIVIGTAIAIIARVINDAAQPNPPGRPPEPPGPPGPPPSPNLGGRTQFTQQQSTQPRQSTPRTPRLRSGFNVPSDAITAFVPNEVLVESAMSAAALDAVAANYGVTRLESVRIALINRTLHRLRIDDGVPARAKIAELARGPFSGAQVNHLFQLAQAGALNAEQYAPTKLNIPGAHRYVMGNGITVAVIDSAVDTDHPDLNDAITSNYNATGSASPAHPHGTGMAGAIAGRRTLLSIGPRIRLLTVQAFNPSTNTAEGTTLNILKGLDWAVAQGARIVNMSFAGPPDPRLSTAMQAAANRNVVLIAAAGNAGPASPALYPAADPNVIAVTATDNNDSIFGRAVRGSHIAVAAPGVEILVPSTGGQYQFTTGTSVASAEISGVVALLLERNPRLTPKEIRAILMRTAKDLGPAGRDRDYGAGLVDALEAVTAAAPRTH